MLTDSDTRPGPTTSRRARRAWKIGGALAAVVALGFGVVQTVTALAHEEHTELKTFDASAVRLIDIDNDAGKVRLLGSSDGRDTIKVTTHVSDGFRPTRHHERLDGDRLVLDTGCPIFSNFCGVTYTVETPDDVDVRVHGELGTHVENIAGAVDIDADQGSVELADIRGSLRVSTDQGGVHAIGLRSSEVEARSDQGGVFLRFVEPPRRVEARSDQGDVEVVLPTGDESYQVDADTDQGSVTRDINSGPDGDGAISAHSDQGDVILRYPDG